MIDPFNHKDYEDFVNSEGVKPPKELDSRSLTT